MWFVQGKKHADNVSRYFGKLDPGAILPLNALHSKETRESNAGTSSLVTQRNPVKEMRIVLSESKPLSSSRRASVVVAALWTAPIEGHCDIACGLGDDGDGIVNPRRGQFDVVEEGNTPSWNGCSVSIVG